MLGPEFSSVIWQNKVHTSKGSWTGGVWLNKKTSVISSEFHNIKMSSRRGAAPEDNWVALCLGPSNSWFRSPVFKSSPLPPSQYVTIVCFPTNAGVWHICVCMCLKPMIKSHLNDYNKIWKWSYMVFFANYNYWQLAYCFHLQSLAIAKGHRKSLLLFIWLFFFYDAMGR